MTDYIDFNITCYGKIPAYNDFIRYQAGHPVLKAFDRWVQFGIQHLFGVHKKRHYQTFDTGPTINFIYTPNIERGVLVGILHPSHDAVSRRYPLILGALVEYGPGCEAVQSFPIFFSELLKKARELTSQIHHGLPREEVLIRLQELEQCPVYYQINAGNREPVPQESDWHKVPASLIPIWLSSYLSHRIPGILQTPLAVFWVPDSDLAPVVKDDPLMAKDFIELMVPQKLPG